MTTAQLETDANRGDIAKGDFNIARDLRWEVLPDFYRRVGDVTWLRKTATLSITASNRGPYDLPNDFRSMVAIYLPPTTQFVNQEELKYIGENPALVAAAEVATTATRPTGFYIVHKVSDSKFRALKLDKIPDQAYTAAYSYRSRLVFADDTTSVDLDQYIPEDYQQALLHKLREHIYIDRYGMGDGRAQYASSQYEAIIDQIVHGAHDLARRNHMVFVR